VQDEDTGASTYEIPPVDPLPADMSPPSNGEKPQAAIPLDRSFRVSLVAKPAGGAIMLSARVSGARDYDLEWTATGGTLTVEGGTARFAPDDSRHPMVMVRASSGHDRLDVARFFPETRNV